MTEQQPIIVESVTTTSDPVAPEQPVVAPEEPVYEAPKEVAPPLEPVYVEASKEVAPKEVAPPIAPVVYREASKDVMAEEKSVIPLSPRQDTKPDEDSKALVLIENIQEVAEEKPSEGSVNRDMALARVTTEKRLSLIKAWEESEKSKAENKAHKKHKAIEAWENSKRAAVEAELKKIEEQLEKKKAEYAEEIKNRIAKFHLEAEEKRALVEAKKGEEVLKAEEIAAKHRATGTVPRKLLGYFKCFSLQV
ncbi:hypothetical protein RIF29_13318 [Crotalaria pallida]|uniref:Remorin n=1 Tax=Crotalaria pallida TaxID=3830 RepID=A0AAN9IPB1_CROPI